MPCLPLPECPGQFTGPEIGAGSTFDEGRTPASTDRPSRVAPCVAHARQNELSEFMTSRAANNVARAVCPLPGCQAVPQAGSEV